MSYGSEQYQSSPWGAIAEQADVSERAAFIKKTYAHLLAAILAFCALEVFYFQSGIAQTLAETIFARGRGAWFVVILLFTGVAWLANYWAMSATSVGMQYAGLGLYVVAQSLIFAPILFFANSMGGDKSQIIPTAGLITLLMFAALTVTVFVTGHDFSFLRSALIIGSFGLIGLALCGWMFGFNLGTLFCVAGIVLASGYILYDTSNVMHHYRVGQHVAASLALFAAVAMLFWYVLQLVMSLQSRD